MSILPLLSLFFVLVVIFDCRGIEAATIRANPDEPPTKEFCEKYEKLVGNKAKLAKEMTPILECVTGDKEAQIEQTCGLSTPKSDCSEKVKIMKCRVIETGKLCDSPNSTKIAVKFFKLIVKHRLSEFAHCSTEALAALDALS
ncbi:unnamed protein product, partial [Mesorhabditis belari]|uniref:Uncharacterized protein n=1 Tax=Mesorhabditis belari TaxID=2138241 RepID=A0AAF3FFX4_9BILA